MIEDDLSESSDAAGSDHALSDGRNDAVRAGAPAGAPAGTRAGTRDGTRDGTRRERPPKRALGDVGEIAEGCITGLRERRAGCARYVIEVDERAATIVSAEVIGALGLRVGGVIDAERAEQLREAAGQLEVFDKGVALLAIRARSTRDLQLRLRRAGALAPAITAAVERLQRLGYLDDEAYARNHARSRALSGGVSKRRIGQELQRQGVAREIVQEAVAETLADVGIDETDAAMRIAVRRARSLRDLDPRKQRQRLYAYLARRGYDLDVVTRVVASVLDELARDQAVRDDAARDALDDAP